MRIKKLIPDSNIEDFGLKINEMDRMKQVVGLFGKNGAGKTRLLRYLQLYIGQNMQYLNDLRQGKTPQSLTRSQFVFSESEKNDGFAPIFEIKMREKSIEIANNMSEADFAGYNLCNTTYPQLKQNCLKSIRGLCQRDIERKYLESNGENVPDEKKEKIQLYELIKKIVKKIMGNDLSYYAKMLTPVVTFDNRDFNLNELSNGEKELFSFCVFLAAQKHYGANNTASLKEKLIIIDEPELYLHPQAQIEVLAYLRELVGEHGQIWIATHSIPLLSKLDREEIWFLDKGKIIFPSIETPSKVLDSTVGEENIDELESFLSSPYEWAASKFAFECLFSSLPKKDIEKDPQGEQVVESINQREKREIKILDFGAGEGRIGKELLDKQTLAEKVYYQPLENNRDYHSDLVQITDALHKISKVDEERKRKILVSLEELKENEYKNFFDEILLVNVLHEISPDQWESTLSTLLQCLKEEGNLLILEDQSIPRGENAHKYGFLILGGEEFSYLFKRKVPLEQNSHPDERYKDRLTCVYIPKKDSVVTRDSIIDALKAKKKNCRSMIAEIKENQNKTAKLGRRYAFFSQLYTNVDLALFDLENCG